MTDDSSRFLRAIEKYQEQQQPEPEQPDFRKLLKRYKRDHLQNVLPAIRRNSCAMTRGERRRLAKQKSIRRVKRQAARQRRAAERHWKRRMKG